MRAIPWSGKKSASARGYKTTILMDYESSFGVAPSTAAGVALPVNSFGVTTSRAKNSAQTLTGRRDPVEPFDGNVETAGDVVVPVDARAFGYWLKLLFGDPTDATVTTGVYSHTYKPGDEAPSAVLQCSYGTDTPTYGKFSGCKVSSLQISAGGDEELTATISVVGKNAAYSTTNYNDEPTAVAMKRFSNFQATLKKDNNAFGVCTGFSFTIDNGLDTDTRTLGSAGELYDIPEGIMSVTGTATCLFTSLTMLQAAQASTEMSLELSFQIDASNKLVFLFPEVQLQFQGPTVDGPAGVRTEYSFVAYYNNSSDNTVCKVTLTNDQASY